MEFWHCKNTSGGGRGGRSRDSPPVLAGLLGHGEYERIDALGAGAPRAAAGLWRSWSLGQRALLQACGGPELASAGGHLRARRDSAPDAAGSPRETAARGEHRSSARRQVM